MLTRKNFKEEIIDLVATGKKQIDDTIQIAKIMWHTMVCLR